MKNLQNLKKSYLIGSVLTALGWIITIPGLFKIVQGMNAGLPPEQLIQYNILLFNGAMIIVIASFFIAICEIKKDNLISGMLLLLFNYSFTFGIWGFVLSIINIRRKTEVEVYYPDMESLKVSYKWGKIISWISVAIPIIGWVTFSFFGGIFIGIQEIRRNKTLLGVMIIIFNSFTLGIFGLVVCIIRTKQIKKDTFIQYVEK